MEEPEYTYDDYYEDDEEGDFGFDEDEEDI